MDQPRSSDQQPAEILPAADQPPVAVPGIDSPRKSPEASQGRALATGLVVGIICGGLLGGIAGAMLSSNSSPEPVATNAPPRIMAAPEVPPPE